MADACALFGVTQTNPIILSPSMVFISSDVNGIIDSFLKNLKTGTHDHSSTGGRTSA